MLPNPVVQQVKSRLLPLTEIENSLERLVERLPRSTVELDLRPISDIAVINASKGEYEATGHKPSFDMRFVGCPLQPGWYYLEAALTRNNGSRMARIRASIGWGGTESVDIPIPTNLRGSVREVLYIPANVRALQWLPTANAGFFSQSQLLLHKVTTVESALRRIHRVLFDLWRFRGRHPDCRAGLTWWGAISNLNDAYQRTANVRQARMAGNDYLAFIANNEARGKAKIYALKRQVLALKNCPVITLLMYVRDPLSRNLREAVESVRTQIYPHWQLLLAGDFASNSQSLAISDEYSNKDARIRIVGQGIDVATALNAALQSAGGQFVARITQNDLIPRHALLHLANEISKFPDVDLIYADDDCIDEMGKRFEPRFKPDWNPDLFFSCNYIGNLTIYRRARVLEMGGYRSGFDGAEDYDLSLRYLKGIPEERIRHIPRVLLHRRTPLQSLAPPAMFLPQMGRGEAELAHQSGKRALQACMDGLIVSDGPAFGLYRIRHPLPVSQPRVTIIIPTRDRVDMLRKCIDSIRHKTTYANWDILVVDNQSIESDSRIYFEEIQKDARIQVVSYEKPFNYSALNNYAVQFAAGDILALVNNDIEVISGEWLSEMVSHAIRPKIGAVGAKLLYLNGLVQHAGVIIGIGGVAGHAHRYLKGDDYGYCHRAVVTQNLSAVTGACLVVRKDLYQLVQGLNEENLAVAFNDVDFCLKLLVAGYRNVLTPYAQLFHHESVSRGHDDTLEKHERFVQEFEYMKATWRNWLRHDPAYNPNLSLEFEDFSLSAGDRAQTSQ